MKANDDRGRPLDSAFTVRAARDGSGWVVRMESRSGRKGGPNARNSDYMAFLQVLLERMASLRASLEDVQVVSQRAQHLTAEERRVHVQGHDYPISLGTISDFPTLARRVAAGQRAAGKPGAVPSANPTIGALKRIDLQLWVLVLRGDASITDQHAVSSHYSTRY